MAADALMNTGACGACIYLALSVACIPPIAYLLLFVAATLPQFWAGPTQLYLPFRETMQAFVTIVFTIDDATRLTRPQAAGQRAVARRPRPALRASECHAQSSEHGLGAAPPAGAARRLSPASVPGAHPQRRLGG